MTLNLITLATVKKYLGLTAITYDPALTTLIPTVSADVRRILNNQYSDIIGATFNPGSTQLIFGKLRDDYPLGTIITHDNIPEDTYLVSYNYKTGYFTMSAAPTGAGDYINPTINVSMFDVISKMIWYKFKKQNTSSAMSQSVSSESFSGVSVTYSDKQINKRWNYPQALIDDLGIPNARIG